MGVESALRDMIRGWAEYAEMHETSYGSLIGNDYVLGPAWAEQGKALITLLNGVTGRFDCGTLDGFIRDTMKNNGTDPEA